VDRQPATDGSEIGQLAITDLHNHGMPFVRYLNGDTAVPATGPCPCGRGLPRLAKVVGRTLDALRTPDGRVVPGEFMPFVFNDTPGVLRFRVHQRAIDRLEISLVVDGAWGPSSERRARDLIARVFGAAMAIDFAFVDDLPLGPSGKARVTMSDLE
jgi:phenylacetate-CoA ligase